MLRERMKAALILSTFFSIFLCHTHFSRLVYWAVFFSDDDHVRLFLFCLYYAMCLCVLAGGSLCNRAMNGNNLVRKAIWIELHSLCSMSKVHKIKKIWKVVKISTSINEWKKLQTQQISNKRLNSSTTSHPSHILKYLTSRKIAHLTIYMTAKCE